MAKDNLQQAKSVGILSLGVLSISTGGIFTRFAQSAGVGSIEIAAYRLLLAVLILTPIVLIKHRNLFHKIDRNTISACVLAGTFLAIHFATWITSLEYTSISSSVVLVTTTPLWVSLYSVVRYRQKMGSKTILGLALVLIGGVVVTAAEVCAWRSDGLTCAYTSLGGKNPLLGNFLALMGAWMAAGYLLSGKRIRATIELTPYVFWVYGIGSSILLILSFVMHGSQITNTPADGWIWLLLLAIIPQLIGHTTFNWSLKHFSTTLVSVIIQAEPIGSTLLGILLFHEIPSAIKWAGIILILTGIFSVSTNEVQTENV